jgi:hypothetical protein
MFVALSGGNTGGAQAPDVAPRSSQRSVVNYNIPHVYDEDL